MSLCVYLVLCLFVVTFQTINGWERRLNHMTSNVLGEIEKAVQHADKDLLEKVAPADEKVSLRLYYECFCPYCNEFDYNDFKPVVEKLNQYLDIKTYPYGNARTYKHKGKYVFRCQNGPAECYGNMLHACALDLMPNKTEAILFNACMMKPRNASRGSDDAAADECGKIYNVNAEPIKECAKGDRGVQLLKYYGDESKKAKFHYVPYILINGKLTDGDNFMSNVCAAFANPPPPCQKKNI